MRAARGQSLDEARVAPGVRCSVPAAAATRDGLAGDLEPLLEASGHQIGAPRLVRRSPRVEVRTAGQVAEGGAQVAGAPCHAPRRRLYVAPVGEAQRVDRAGRGPGYRQRAPPPARGCGRPSGRGAAGRDGTAGCARHRRGLGAAEVVDADEKALDVARTLAKVLAERPGRGRVSASSASSPRIHSPLGECEALQRAGRSRRPSSPAHDGAELGGELDGAVGRAGVVDDDSSTATASDEGPGSDLRPPPRPSR